MPFQKNNSKDYIMLYPQTAYSKNKMIHSLNKSTISKLKHTHYKKKISVLSHSFKSTNHKKITIKKLPQKLSINSKMKETLFLLNWNRLIKITIMKSILQNKKFSNLQKNWRKPGKIMTPWISNTITKSLK